MQDLLEEVKENKYHGAKYRQMIKSWAKAGM